MKLSLTILVCLVTAVFNLLGLFCNALPILVNLNKEQQRHEGTTFPPKQVIDIYSKDLLSAKEDLALHLGSNANPFRPTSITLSDQIDPLNHQTVFLNLDPLKDDSSFKEDFDLLKSTERGEDRASRLLSWLLPSLWKRKGKLFLM